MFVAATVTSYLDLLYVGWKLCGFEGFGYISAWNLDCSAQTENMATLT